MALIEANEGIRIPGINSPRDFYWVLTFPAPMAGMRYPRADFPWAAVAEAGFGAVVCLEPGAYDPSPLKLLFSRQLEDLIHGGRPRNPGEETRLILEAVNTVEQSLKSGQGVVVHCAGGRGRTGTVIGGVLRRLGYEAKDVVAYLNRIHKARGKPGWPESPWQAALLESGTFDKQH